MELSCFDSQTKAEKGVELEITHPVTRAGTGVFLTLLGADSRVYQAARDEQASRNRARGKATLNTDETKDQTAELLAKCTIAWRGLTAGGKEYVHSFENAKKVHLEYPYIAEQAATFIFTRENFFPKPSES